MSQTSSRRPTILRGARVAATPGAPPQRLDIAIGANGRITAVAPQLPAGAGTVVVDADGLLATPALVDLHQHLDKSRTLADAPNPEGTLAGAVEAFRRYAGTLSRGHIIARARRTAEACLERGTVAIRTHVNVDLETGLTGIEALVALREELRERMHLDIVAFASSSAARAGPEVARGLLEQALALGADTVGGTPNFAPDPGAYIHMLFDVAEHHARPLDLHVDETLDPQAECLARIATETARRGLGGRVVAGHCCSLAAMEDARAAELIATVAAAGVGIVTLPAANLFLQGRGISPLTPRGLTRVGELLDAGAAVAAGSDNIQDAFVPMGTGDMLEIARWTALSAHLLVDAAGVALRMVSTTPAALMGLEQGYGIRPGAWADLLLTEAEDGTDLVRSGPLVRTVFYHGRHVAGPLPARTRN